MLYLILIFLILLIIFTLSYFEVFWRMNIPSLSYLDSIYENKTRVNSTENVYISLTTIPDRIHKISKTLCTILHQSRRVDKIYLNIPYKTRKGQRYTIPPELESLKNIEIFRFEKDFGPSSKLLPQLFRNGLIIVLDDDVMYGSQTVETLVDAYYKYSAPITYFGFNIFDKTMESDLTAFGKYLKGHRLTDSVTGHFGYILHTHMLGKKVFDYSSAPPQAIKVDDIWISFWLQYYKHQIHAIGFGAKTYGGSNPDCQGTPALLSDKRHEENLITANYIRKYLS